MLDLVILFLSGLAGGFVAGFLGIGGGVIYILILPAALSHAGVQHEEIAQFIIANSIFGVLFASLSATVAQIRFKNFYKKESLWVSVPGAAAAVLVLNFVVITPWYSKFVFDLIVVCLLTFLAANTLVSIGRRKKTEPEKSHKGAMSFAGAMSGSLSSLSGLGGGALLVPMLNIGLRMDIKKAKSISLVMIFLTSLAMTISNLSAAPLREYDYHMGYIIFPVAIPLVGGVILASPLGVKTAQNVKQNIIRLVFVVFLLIVIVEKLFSSLS